MYIHICIYIHIYICVYIYAYINAYINACIHAHLHTHLYTHTYIYIYIYIHTRVHTQGNKIIACMSHMYGSDVRYVHAFECIERGEAATPSVSALIGLSNNTESEIVRLSASCLSKQGMYT